MIKGFKIVLSLGLCLGSYSCYYDKILEQEIPDIPTDQEIFFSTDIEPLFSRSGKDCTACHNGLLQNPDLQVGNAYNALVPGGYVIPGDAEGSLFYQKLPGNGHAFDVGFTLSGEEIAIIKTWIDRGAENN